MRNHLIIVFLKWPEPGTVKTRLAEAVGTVHAVEIYRSLVKEVGAVLTGCTDADVAVSYTPAEALAATQSWLTTGGFSGRPIQHWWPQPESDLGSRQVAAVSQAFAAGYQKVALIGTDCIDLTASTFSLAWQQLDDADWVFGPARDGGYYLGATKPAAPSPEKVFDHVRWSTEHTLRDCQRHIEDHGGSVIILETLVDVDDYEDWLLVKDRVRV